MTFSSSDPFCVLELSTFIQIENKNMLGRAKIFQPIEVRNEKSINYFNNSRGKIIFKQLKVVRLISGRMRVHRIDHALNKQAWRIMTLKKQLLADSVRKKINTFFIEFPQTW